MGNSLAEKNARPSGPGRYRAAIVRPLALAACLVAGQALLPAPARAEATAPTSTVTSNAGPFYRHFRLTLTSQREVQSIVDASLSLGAGVHELYYRTIEPHVPGFGGKLLFEVWSFAWTYVLALWPHELGHYLRAPQVDARFVFHNFVPYLPHTTVDITRPLSDYEAALISSAGFEVNNQVAKTLESRFYRDGYAWRDELAQAIVQELFFAMYGLVIFPANTADPDTWIRTRGDPVHITLPVYQRYTGRPAVRDNGTVDPELASLYWQMTLMSAIWPMLDPLMFIALFEDPVPGAAHIKQVPYLVGDRSLGWSYGTRLNPSPYGYELYFTNYLSLHDVPASVYLRYARPFQDYGIGIEFPSLYSDGKVNFGATWEAWVQEDTGFGNAFAIDMNYAPRGDLGFFMRGSWKDTGYIPGRPVDMTLSMFVGLDYRLRAD